MNLLRRLAIRIGRPRAPDIRVSLRFRSATALDTDFANFDSGDDDPPQSDWPFRALRPLGIVQVDDFFAIQRDDARNNPWGAAVWVLPLRAKGNDLHPVTIWNGGPFDGIGFAWHSPNWPSARAYTAEQIELTKRCIRDFAGQLAGQAELRLDGKVSTLLEIEQAIDSTSSSWLI